MEFTMSDVIYQLNNEVNESTIRYWLKEFNIETNKSDGGHRRFTDENLSMLLRIHQLRKKNYSINAIKRQLEQDKMVEVEVKTKLEVENDLKDFLNKELGEVKVELNFIKEELLFRDQVLAQLIDGQKQLASGQEEMSNYFKTVRELLEAPPEEPKKGFFSRLFSKKEIKAQP